MGHQVANEETLDRKGIAGLQRRKLADMFGEVLANNPFYQRKLAGVRFDAAKDPLDGVPFTTRAEVQQDQLDHPPYGTNLTYARERYVRLHQTSGSTTTPLRWLDTADSWAWFKGSWKTLYRAAGLKSDDRLVFPFSFGPFIGFWGGFEAAGELGNLVLAAGGMTTSARLGYLLDNQVTVVCCTPTYALRMAEVAEAEGLRLTDSPVRSVIVAGEPGGNIPAVRARIQSAWGARVFDHAGMTEIGAYGFECVEAPGGMHVMESEFIAEVIDPVTAAPVGEGREGELVLTNLGRWGSPLIRYRTGDQVRLIRNRCACGRWFARLEGGILGRIDDMLVVRGNNVFPSAVEGVLREFREVGEFSLVVERSQSLAELEIRVELHPGVDGKGVAERIAEKVRDRLLFRPQVTVVPVGSLPRAEMKSRRVVRREAR
jgi:phenylacetate-CoA ligase